jgi:hypothetical protein
MQRMGKESDLKPVPALALIEQSDDAERMAEKFDRYELQSDRSAVLAALEELANPDALRQSVGSIAE